MDPSAREIAIQKFLDDHGYRNWVRSHLTGDASSRAYELVESNSGSNVLLMNAPPQPDGPPIRDGMPYSQIARLAEDMRSFAGVALRLASHGFRVPEILAQDLDQGLLVIENLGMEEIVTQDRLPIMERYMASMETLAQLHDVSWESSVLLKDGSVHTLGAFDSDVIMIEVELLAQWYAPYKLGRPLNQKEKVHFETIWQNLATLALAGENSILLRDYHSPNIIWMENAPGLGRTALIDFQDALIGPSVYDVASIAQDARVDISAENESLLVKHYLHSRNLVDTATFEQVFAMLAAQRATKILGIFVRLSQRDNKPAYLAHLPRVEAYLQRAIRHPALCEYKAWLQTVFND